MAPKIVAPEAAGTVERGEEPEDRNRDWGTPRDVWLAKIHSSMR
jgi:hypothetical protein